MQVSQFCNSPPGYIKPAFIPYADPLGSVNGWARGYSYGGAS